MICDIEKGSMKVKRKGALGYVSISALTFYAYIVDTVEHATRPSRCTCRRIKHDVPLLTFMAEPQ